MKTKLLFVLILLGAVLVGIGFYARDRSSSETALPKTFSAAELRNRPKLLKPNGPKQNPSTTKVVYVTNQFHWSDVESSDYRKYIANLRAIHCPETTIKDIILTDILKLYAARRGQFFHNGREFKFWETDEKRKLNAKQLDEREKQLATIDKEIPAVLRELLGINYEREINKYFVETNEDERRLNFLPEGKRAELLALREQTEAMRERILEEANGNLSPADLEALRTIEQHRKAELARLLSGSELAEFELRTSPTADRLRGELIGFNPSESEFRQIYELQQAVEDQFAFAPQDESALREKTALQNDVQEELRRQLGDARFAEYQRAQNPDFRDACVFTEIYELPISAAQTIFEIKQVAEAERQNLLANASVPDAQKLEALQAIQTETEKSLRATMGPKVFANYNQSTGGWIQKLGATTQ